MYCAIHDFLVISSEGEGIPHGLHMGNEEIRSPLNMTYLILLFAFFKKPGAVVDFPCCMVILA